MNIMCHLDTDYSLLYNSIMNEVAMFRNNDVPWDRVLNSICSKPLDIGIEAFCAGIDTNLGDPRIFQGTVKAEKHVIEILGDMLGHKNCAGNILSGGTEANFMALYAAKILKGDKIIKPEIIISPTVHFSIQKAIKILGLVPKIADINEQYKLKPLSVANLINPNTIAIIATAGSSEFGSIDPIEDIGLIAAHAGIYFHVDAATGGFIIPFAKKVGYKLPAFDFSVQGVCSITIDPHKYGLAPIPAGCVLFKDKSIQNAVLNESFFWGTPDHTTFIGTRPGASALAVYAVLKYLGNKGFIEITRKNFEITQYLVKALKENGFILHIEPELNIVNIEIKNARKLCSVFQKEGWIVSAHKKNENILRIVINFHVTKAMIDSFLNLLYKLCPQTHSYE